MNTRPALNSMEMAEAVLTAASRIARISTRTASLNTAYDATLAAVPLAPYLDTRVNARGGSLPGNNAHIAIDGVIARCLPGGRP